MNNPRLAVHIITQDRPEQVFKLFNELAYYVDVIRVLDGGKDSDILSRLCQGFSGAEYYHKAWDDDFAKQHNFLMEQSQPGEWVYFPDDDESSTLPMRKAFRGMIGVERPALYRCRLALIQDGMPQHTAEWLGQPGNVQQLFHKQALVFNDGQVKFEGITHPAINEDELRKRGYDIVISDHFGCHIKTTLSFILGDIRSGFMNPTYQGISEDLGDELRLRFEGIDVVEDWHTQLERMDEGSVGEALEDFFIAYRWHPTLEKWFWYYFLIKHPEKLWEIHPEMILNPDDAILRFFMFMGNKKRIVDSIRHGDQTGTYLYIWHLDIKGFWKQKYGIKVKISDMPHDDARGVDIANLTSLKMRMKAKLEVD